MIAHPMVRQKTISKVLTPSVPKELITAPVFAATRQTGSRTLDIDGVKWTLGAPRPDMRQFSPAFDIRHGRLCFALLSFRDRLINGREIRFSINELAHRMANSNNGQYSRQLLNLLFDLRDTWIQLEYPDTSKTNFSVIESLRVNNKPVRRSDAADVIKQQGELWLDFVNLSPEFFGLMQRIEKLGRIRLDVLNEITSPLAQSIYTYIPSRAVHHTQLSPFAIRLTNALEQLSHPVPPYKSFRKNLFTQNRTSVIAQLDGRELIDGVLRVDLAETKDGTDYNLLAWVEKDTSDITPAQPRQAKSKLLSLWLETGRSKVDFDQRMKKRQPLSDYAEELLTKSKVTIDGSRTFFEMTCALLGENRFHAILSEAKGDALEGDPGNHPTKRLIYRLTEAVKGLRI